MKKTIVLTGAGGGMGRAITRFLRQDYTVVAIDRNASKLSNLDGESVITVCKDLRDVDLVKHLDSLEINQLFGLINLAAVSTGAPVSKLNDDDWQTSLDINITAPMRLTRWASNKMILNKAGCIINVGSPVGIVGANKASYAASKAALQGLTMSTARELGVHNIRVNTLLPGPTITDMTEDWSEEKRTAIAQGTFLKRLCKPEEIAQVIGFLLSEQASYLTASTLDMTAGSLWGH